MLKRVVMHNLYFVQARGDLLFIGTHPGGMTREQALNLAAYLVVNARALPGDLEFADVVEGILSLRENPFNAAIGNEPHESDQHINGDRPPGNCKRERDGHEVKERR